MIDTDSPFTPSEEAEFAADFAERGLKAYADLLRRQADEPRNAPIRDKIIEIARKFDRLA